MSEFLLAESEFLPTPNGNTAFLLGLLRPCVMHVKPLAQCWEQVKQLTDSSVFLLKDPPLEELARLLWWEKESVSPYGRQDLYRDSACCWDTQEGALPSRGRPGVLTTKLARWQPAFLKQSSYGCLPLAQFEQFSKLKHTC